MRFYQVEGILTNLAWVEENNDRRTRNERAFSIQNKSERFYEAMGKKAYFFVSDLNKCEVAISVGVIERGLKTELDVERMAKKFFKTLGIAVGELSIEEVTFQTLRSMLSMASRNDLIRDDDSVMDEFDLSPLSGYRSVQFGENLIPDEEPARLYELAETYLLDENAFQELDRIFANTESKGAHGHPVHYLLKTDDQEVRREAGRILVRALYRAGRLKNRRYVFSGIEEDEPLRMDQWHALYESCVGGALMVRIDAMLAEDNEFASAFLDNVEKLSNLIREYRNRVLTILEFPRECTKMKELFFEKLQNMTVVEIGEELASGDRAKNFLRLLAERNEIRPDRNLYAKLEAGKSYLAPELRTMFEEWYDHKLKNGIFPQYKEVESVRRNTAKEKPKGQAIDTLEELVGLAEAKKVIHNALNYYKAQKLFADKGMKAADPAMHMVFTGNPGSAKTTVARLFARIMRDNGLLSKGHLVEVGRGDLVGKYVGWTAPTVKRKFKEALGGVLFIDEAYSLVDDKDGLFGDEAINTIVQEMENNRDTTVVIFAGYPDKMEKFLQKNPGLRSRIAFHVPFADYDAEELLSIAELMVKKFGQKLSDSAKEKLLSLFDTARKETDFGNGRYVRNILEHARMAQATRLVQMDPEAVTKEDIATIEAEDIEAPPAKPKKAGIGFSAA